MFLQSLKGLCHLFCLLFLLGACLLPNQDFRDVFANKKMPEKMSRFADDYLSLRKNNDRIRKLIQRNEKQDRLVIATMDGGLSVFHPELIDIINWKKDRDGNIRAGFDPLGQTKLANSVFLDFSLYAYGAEKIEQGQIYGEHPDPLELLAKTQKRFQEILKEEYEKEANRLDKTVFRKVLNSSINYFRALSIVAETSGIDQEDYRDMKKEGLLLKEGSRVGAISLEARLTDTYMLPAYNAIFDADWSEYRSFPLNTETMWTIEGADIFYRVLIATNERLEAELNVNEAIKNYYKFKSHHSSSQKQVQEWERGWKLTDYPYSLANALSYKMYGSAAVPPEVSFVDDLRDDLITEKMILQPLLKMPVKVSTQELRDYLDRTTKLAEQFLAKYYGANGDITERTLAKKVKKKLALAAKAKELLVGEDMIDWDIDNSPKVKRLKEEYRRKNAYRGHPYFSRETFSSSHHTHVTATAAEGNKKHILIEPIRPITSSMPISIKKIYEVAAEFEAEFKEFLKHPVIYAGLRDFMKTYDLDPSGLRKDKLISEVVKLVRGHALKEIKEAPIEFLFIYQIIDSIRHVGENNILLTNISLGTESEKATESSKASDPTRDFYESLKTEYFKFKVSKAILDYAPNSLFLIAAGNSNAWVDAYARSALPFDLSSTFFARYETANNKLPNHVQKNTLGVMSVSEVGHLSKFTNIAIHKNVAVVGAPGENVLAPVNMYDESYTKKIISKALGGDVDQAKGRDLSSFAHEEVLKLYYGENYSKLEKQLAQLDVDERLEFLGDEVTRLLGNNLKLLSVIDTKLAEEHVLARAAMEGTSMATPMTVQATIRQIVKQAKERRLKLGSLTGKKGFLPEDLQKMIQDNTRPLSEDKFILPINLVKDTRRIKPNKLQKDLEAKLAKFSGRSPVKSCKDVIQSNK